MAELGRELARDYEGREPLLVAPLPSSVVFLSDLSRALPIAHGMDTIQLAAYEGGQTGGVRVVKDLDHPIAGRDVIVVEDVVDTGLTLNFLSRTLSLRDPASLAAVNPVPYLDSAQYASNMQQRANAMTAPLAQGGPTDTNTAE